jgi:hypothetical protein
MLLDVAFVAFMALGAASIGGRLVRAAGLSFSHRSDHLAVALPLGLGLMALAVLLLGEFGVLTQAAIGVLLVAPMLTFSRDIWPRWPARVDLFDGLLIFGLVGTLLTALAPVTDGDALAYHLQLPKTFLQDGAIRFDPYQHESAYPMVVELLYAMGLSWRGPVACRLISWLLGVCLMLSVTALARPSLGYRVRWAGTIALLVPAISNGMTAPLNDVPLASFGASALVSWMAWRDGPTMQKTALAGTLAGLMLGVKYPAVIWVGLLGLATLLVAVRRKLALWHAMAFAFTALLVGGVWYVRAWWFTGNPVYPFFRSVFGGSGIAEVLLPGRRPLGLAPWKLLTALVPMTFDPSRFESRWHQIGPVFVIFLPLLLVARPPRRVVLLVGLGYLFFTLCLTMRQSPRFSLTALGPMAVGVAWVASWAAEQRGWTRRLVVVCLGVVLAGESAWAVYRARHGIGVVMGMERADDYLSRREPTYRVGRWMSEHLPPDARVIGQEQRGFYFPRPYTIERRHRLVTGVGIPGQVPQEVIDAYLREGHTHLLMCPPVPESAAYFDPALSRALETWLASRSPCFEREISDPEGITRRYAIYEFRPGPTVARAEASEHTEAP